MIPDTSWSNLLDTQMGEYVMSRIDTNPSLMYHNGSHVRRLYAKAKEWRLNYDASLDAAILWHDAIYDNQPEKEARSAELVKEAAKAMPQWFESLEIDQIVELIMTTKDHTVSPGISSLMIKLDLAELGDPERRRINFWDILRESQELYEINELTASLNTLKFMSTFRTTIENNLDMDKNSRLFDGDGIQFWENILDGITESAQMANEVFLKNRPEKKK